MTEGSNARLVCETWAEGKRAAESGQLDGWLEFFSEEIEWEAVEDAPDAGTYRGHASIRGYFEDWLSTVDGFKPEVVEVTEVGDRLVVADTRIRGRVKGTDSELVFDYSTAVRIAGDRIAHIKEFREHDSALAYAEDRERRTT